MNRSKKVTWLAVGIVAWGGSMAGFAHAASSASADETAIRAQSTDWVKAYNGGDAKAVAALYAEDAMLLPPGAPGAAGPALRPGGRVRDAVGFRAVRHCAAGSDVGTMPGGHQQHELHAVDITLEYSRPFRALKLWLAMRAHGAQALQRVRGARLEQLPVGLADRAAYACGPDSCAI